jgi:hypothetical protein
MALFTAVLKRVARCARYLAAASRLIVSIAALLAWLLCGSALVVGAHITDAAVDIVLVCLPNGWIGAWLDRRRPWLLALLCAGTCGFAARYIAGHSAGCVCRAFCVHVLWNDGVRAFFGKRGPDGPGRLRSGDRLCIRTPSALYRCFCRNRPVRRACLPGPCRGDLGAT